MKSERLKVPEDLLVSVVGQSREVLLLLEVPEKGGKTQYKTAFQDPVDVLLPARF